MVHKRRTAEKFQRAENKGQKKNTATTAPTSDDVGGREGWILANLRSFFRHKAAKTRGEWTRAGRARVATPFGSLGSETRVSCDRSGNDVAGCERLCKGDSGRRRIILRTEGKVRERAWRRRAGTRRRFVRNTHTHTHFFSNFSSRGSATPVDSSSVYLTRRRDKSKSSAPIASSGNRRVFRLIPPPPRRETGEPNEARTVPKGRAKRSGRCVLTFEVTAERRLGRISP